MQFEELKHFLNPLEKEEDEAFLSVPLITKFDDIVWVNKTKSRIITVETVKMPP